MNEKNILNFWFKELTPKDWFKKDLSLDQMIRDKFLETLEKTIAGEYFDLTKTPKGTLAQVIVLDQFSRNIFRDTKRAFSQDPLSLHIAQAAIRKGFHQDLEVQERAFLYMPFMHSESKLIHEQALILFSEEGLQNNYDFELRHKKIIDRFGRYPHRNKILERVSTKEEEEFLKEEGSSF